MRELRRNNATVPSQVPFQSKAWRELSSTPRQAKTPTACLTMNSALEKLYAELLNEVDKEEPEEITDAEKAKRFLAEKQITIEKLREVRGFGRFSPQLCPWGFRPTALRAEVEQVEW